MNKIVDYFNNKSKIFNIFTGIILLMIVTIVDSDYLIKDLGLSILYLIPISFYAWFLGTIPTVIISALSSFAEIMVNRSHLIGSEIITDIEGAMKFIFFLLIGLMIIKIKSDIQKMKYILKTLEVTLEKEKEINVFKSSFISNISHEFRTPLSTIQAINSIIKNYSEKMDNEEKTTQHLIIEDQINNMVRILDDFVVVGKIESEKLYLKGENASIKLKCERILNELKISSFDISRINYSYEGEEYFFCDKRIVRQIIVNLLTNAFKYSSEKIIFNVKCFSDKLIIRVKDSGIGIPEEEQKQIFEQFYRASNVDNASGTGLGLSIVKKSVVLLKGNIEFNSSLNKGTEFIITIPKQELQY